MDTSRHSARRSNAARVIIAGFSLVEVTLAIGIVSSAVVVVVGLFPSGLNTFRQAMNTSVGGQIAQQLINEAQQTDFDVLIKDGSSLGNHGTFNRQPDRYFDEQGTEIVPAVAGSPTASDKLKIVYWVRTRVTPQASLPSLGAGNAAILNSTKISDSTIAAVVVQIANNPSNQMLAQEDGAQDDKTYPLRNLWSGAFQSDTSRKVVQTILYSTLVSCNVNHN